jgi:hypothetical protein
MQRVTRLAVLAASASLAVGCGSEEDPTTAGTSSPPTVSTTASTTATAPPAETTTTVEIATTEAAAAASMPDVLCMNLQTAQDTIQAAGVFFSRSEDGTGQDRSQIIDSNWIVVDQRPAPGTPIGEGDAVLTAVKYGEEGGRC